MNEKLKRGPAGVKPAWVTSVMNHQQKPSNAKQKQNRKTDWNQSKPSEKAEYFYICVWSDCKSVVPSDGM